ncbi:MAG: enoyl-CoA hydratase/isomerase family protein [SAR324 cluster bacterium]|nr:enoyl-CoA hydratase/isomerase family protein [SAR324 cluster bacterium]
MSERIIAGPPDQDATRSIMEYQTIRISDGGGGVHTITLYRPEKRNAISIRMRQELSACLGELGQSGEVKALILTGSGPSFSSGFDLKEFAKEDRHEELARSSMAYHRDLWNFPKPTIAAVNGFALGGGLDMALLCDIRLCSENALFGHPEIKFGGQPLFTPLRWIVGEGLARDLCLTGRTIDAAEAHRMGLVSEVLPKDGLLERAGEFARMIAEAPADTLRAVKRTLLESSGKGFEESFLLEHDEPFARKYLKS